MKKLGFPEKYSVHTGHASAPLHLYIVMHDLLIGLLWGKVLRPSKIGEYNLGIDCGKYNPHDNSLGNAILPCSQPNVHGNEPE